MRSEIESMLRTYETTSSHQAIYALKEVIQEVTLNALSTTDFFERAAFYGGTALRIFHGLDRFSEDMDFSLIHTDSSFSMQNYLESMEEGLQSYGFHMKASFKEKRKSTAVQSAFLKGNTIQHLVEIMAMEAPISGVPNNAILSIKVEIDTEPPEGATYERHIRLLPSPYSVLLYDLPSLFAGKMHALLCRNRQNREKGRDFYDYVWYLQQGIKLNISHLEQRMRQSGHFQGESKLTKDELFNLLENRFNRADFPLIQADVMPFIPNPKTLELYSKEFFTSITAQYLMIQ
jgi:hypothetical protein